MQILKLSFRGEFSCERGDAGLSGGKGEAKLSAFQETDRRACLDPLMLQTGLIGFRKIFYISLQQPPVHSPQPVACCGQAGFPWKSVGLQAHQQSKTYSSS